MDLDYILTKFNEQRKDYTKGTIIC